MDRVCMVSAQKFRKCILGKGVIAETHFKKVDKNVEPCEHEWSRT